MSEPFDPFEILRDVNPVDPADLRGAASSPQAVEALEQIISDTRRRSGRRIAVRLRLRRRRRLYILALVPLAAALAAGAWALTRGATQQLTIGCYATADLHARTIVVPAGNEPATTTCGAIWQGGEFGSPSSPPLQACVLPSGAIGVFPSSTQDACTQLKLAPVAPITTSTRQAEASPLALKGALVHKFLANRCMNEQQATATVQVEIRRLRLTNWRVRTNGRFSSSRPCASLAFDEGQQRVLLVPIPEQP